MAPNLPRYLLVLVFLGVAAYTTDPSFAGHDELPKFDGNLHKKLLSTKPPTFGYGSGQIVGEENREQLKRQPKREACPKPEPNPHLKPSSTSVTKPDDHTSEPKLIDCSPEPKPGHQPEPKPGHMPKPKPKPKPKPGHRPEPKPGHQPEPKPGHPPKPEPGHLPEPKPGHMPKPN